MYQGWGIKIRGTGALATLLVATVFAVLAASAEGAPLEVCVSGPGTGECSKPAGLATDFETGTLYVADTGNNRVDVFKENGTEVGTPASFGAGTAPVWIAVDNVATSPSHHDLYTTSGFTVRKFEPDGTLADEFGEKGDGTPEGCQLERPNDQIAVGPNGDVYVADSFKSEPPTNNYVNRVVKFDAAGNCIGATVLFEEVNRFIVGFAVDSGGHSYVMTENISGIRKFAADGSFEYELDKGTEPAALAIDEDDDLFALEQGEKPLSPAFNNFFTEFSPTGTILHRFEYAPSTIPGTPGLAALESPDGDVFASSPSGVKYYSLPPAGPLVFPEGCRVKDNAPGSVRASLQAEVNPEGKETTFKFEYMTQAQFEAEGDEFKNAQSSSAATLEEEGVKAEDFEMHVATQLVQPLEAETAYRCRVVATNADGSATGQEGTFKTGPPFEFGPAWSAEVNSTSAVVNAEGNPEGAEATGQIEYVTDAQYQASGFAEALSTPTPPLDYGSAEAMTFQKTTLSGLAPGTLYHYRLRAHSSSLPPEGAVCPHLEASCTELEHTFRTYESEARPDERGYELVSPPEKNSAEVVGPSNGRGFVETNSILVQAGAANGEAVTYTSWISFEGGQGAPATSQYLSRRTPSGWATENISPFGFQSNLFIPPFLGFSGDLRFGAVKAGETPLAPGCPAGFENLYLREASGSLRCLTPEAPQTTNKFGYCFTYGGASEDGSRVFFRAQVPYADAPKGSGFSLYEAHEGQIRAVSVLPGQSEPAIPTSRTTFGMKTIEGCQTGQSVLHNAISPDGTRAIWSYVPVAKASVSTVSPGAWALTIEGAAGGTFGLSFEGQSTAAIPFNASAATIQAALEGLSTIGAGNVEVSGTGPFTVTFKGPLAGTTKPLGTESSKLEDAPSQLLDRIEGTETVQIDKVQNGSGSGEGTFWAASRDGGIVYFTSPNRLISGVKAEPGAEDLYRYDFSKPLSSRLSDITVKGTAPGDVKGVIGASEDGSVLYYVAGSALTPEAEANQAGQHAEAGKDNLYVYDAAEAKNHFIARLSGEDNLDWETQPKAITARVSPDGQHLAFLSVEAKELAGFDNTLAATAGKFSGGEDKCQIDEVGVLHGSKSCPEAFIYAKLTASLTCASCNPAGSRPLGPALLPGWTSMTEGPRYLSDNGGRLFFETYDRLSPGDENNLRDVYEWEANGSGTCNSSNPDFDPDSGGCHFLVSSGKSEDISHLIDASSDGRDVFFSTRQPLVGWDTNENFDVYDYREGGGFPEPPPPAPVCEGEASCKPPVTPTPAGPTPITPNFTGPGNPKPKKAKHHQKKHTPRHHKKGKGKKHKKGAKKGRS